MSAIVYPATLLALNVVITLEMAGVMPLALDIVGRLGVTSESFTLLNMGYFVAGVLNYPIARRVSGLRPHIVVVGSALVFIAGTALVAAARSPAAFVVGRAVVGLGFFSLLGRVPAQLISTLGASRAHIAAGFVKVTFATGVLLAPYVGRILVDRFGFEVLYAAVAMAALACVAVLARTAPDEANGNHPTVDPWAPGAMLASAAGPIPPVPRRASSLRLHAIAALMTTPITFVTSYLADWLDAGGLSAAGIATAFTVMGTGSIVAGVFIIVARIPLQTSGFAGLSILLVSLAGIIPGRENLLTVTLFGYYLGLDLFTGVFFPMVARGRDAAAAAATLASLSAANAAGLTITSLVAPAVIAAASFRGVVAAAVACMMLCLVLFGIERRSELRPT